jgi:hypothetical protein
MIPLILAIVCGGQSPAAPPDAARSAAAVATLQKELAAQPTDIAQLAAKDFAGTPLTKADAASARELLWKAHVAQVREVRASEVRDRKLTDGELEMPFFLTSFGEKSKSGRSFGSPFTAAETPRLG